MWARMVTTNKLLFHARFFILVAVVWLSSSEPVNAENSLGPNCIKVLGENSRNCDADTIGKGSPFYSISCKPVVNLPHDFCEFHSNQRLRIELERFAQISHILLKEPTFVGRFIRNVTIRNGITFRECKYSGQVDNVELNTKQKFARFSCGDSNSPTGLFVANAIDFNSIVHRTVNLTSLQITGRLDWIVLMDAGTNSEKTANMESSLGERIHFRHAMDSPHGTFGSDWNETKRNNNTRPPINSEGDGKQSKSCPPVSPYHGMPEDYRNYQLVSDNLINELLLTRPCRPGYKVVGSVSDINQCKNGNWQGKGFPKCEVIMPNNPPKVNHATWDYVHADVFHEIYYTCNDGYYLAPSGTGKAVYSVEHDDWIGVPLCSQQQGASLDEEGFTKYQYWLIVISVAVCGVVIVALVVLIIVLIRTKTRKVKRDHEYDAGYFAPDSSRDHDKKNHTYEEINDEIRPLNNIQCKKPDVLPKDIKN